MHFGPQRELHERLSSFRYRQARYCWAWACVSAPVLMVSIHALRTGLGDGAVWLIMVFIAFLSGATLGMALVGAVGLSFGARWAQLCETSAVFAMRWQRTRFIIASLFLVPIWCFECYWTFIAITEQRILFGRPARIVTLADEPDLFLFSLVTFASTLVLIPTYWMSQVRKHFGSRRQDLVISDSGPSWDTPEQPKPKRLTKEQPRLSNQRKLGIDD
ncbi:hypothetical protein DyAD56_22460 [Dyella sp. AD56]|uniref:hypothetical protein n=1 Tax=Dyella sp. AD56 TaxID=1528744 RepID=UPI000C8272D7|nr:hypothetical protein [Dyella sp. AD56]PMQ02801.1 hypothetical protein DyAD56_22460 [Dyella sp. AD56]